MNKEKKKNSIDFKKLSADPRILVVIIAIACAALIGLCVYTSRQTKQAEEQVKAQVQTFEGNKAYIANLLVLKSQNEQHVKRNAEYEALITSDGLSQQDFMVSFDNLCKAYDCRMTLIEFGEEGSVGEVKSLNINLKVEGDFDKLMALCDGIVTQDRYFRIDSVTFSAGTEGKKNADIGVVAFSK